MYSGVVRKTSPFVVRATFSSDEEALAYIKGKQNPDEWTIVHY